MTWEACEACKSGSHCHELTDMYCDCTCGCSVRTPFDEYAAENGAGDDLTRYEQSVLDRALDKIKEGLIPVKRGGHEHGEFPGQTGKNRGS